MPAISEEKLFPIFDSPLKVKLVLKRERPPLLQVVIAGPKKQEHKDPRYVNAANQLIAELKTYINHSGHFPPQGKLVVDMYATEAVVLNIRYPADSPSRYSASIIHMFIIDPITQGKRAGKNKKDSEKLFAILSEKMPVFITRLLATLEQDRFSHEQKKQGRNAIDITMDKDRKEAYILLGLTPGVPWETVKKTYRDKARKAHPDTNKGLDDGSFHTLQMAFDVLRKWHEKTGK